MICEDSIVMPSNFIWPTPGDLGARVVRTLPGKAAKMADGIPAGREKRLKEGFDIGDIMKKAGKLSEHK